MVERLSDSHYVVLILRLLVDQDRRVVHGEVGGADDERWIRFQGVDGVVGALETYLSGDDGL